MMRRRTQGAIPSNGMERSIHLGWNDFHPVWYRKTRKISNARRDESQRTLEFRAA
ncbi:MAG: hypothetical protein JXR73_22830 [Candidatus Omnitrophica bacterium]|nr:hypothetical protein [Candidatus Omnitrophota bacterium]